MKIAEFPDFEQIHRNKIYCGNDAFALIVAKVAEQGSHIDTHPDLVVTLNGIKFVKASTMQSRHMLTFDPDLKEMLKQVKARQEEEKPVVEQVKRAIHSTALLSMASVMIHAPQLIEPSEDSPSKSWPIDIPELTGNHNQWIERPKLKKAKPARGGGRP